MRVETKRKWGGGVRTQKHSSLHTSLPKIQTLKIEREALSV